MRTLMTAVFVLLTLSALVASQNRHHTRRFEATNNFFSR
jgi:hypothetical protein